MGKTNTYPLVNHATGARARAGIIKDPAYIEETAAQVRLASALAAIDRAHLTPEQTGRVVAAMMTDSVAAWLAREIEGAPPLTEKQRTTIARLLAGGTK